MFVELCMVHEKQEGEPGTKVETERGIELRIPKVLFTPLAAFARWLQAFR